MDVADAIRPGPAPGLSLLFAGDCQGQPTHLLGQESVGGLLATLRSQFDFIIIDSAPVLPVPDSQFLAQAVHFGFRLGDIPVPVRYFDEASSINFKRSTIYGIRTLTTMMRFWLHRCRLWRTRLFKPLTETERESRKMEGDELNEAP